MEQSDTGFCGSCGSKLSVKNPKVCVKCGADPKIPEKFCPHCGTKLAASKPEICTKCGSSLKKNSEKKDSGIAILVSIIGFLFLLNPAVGYFVIDKTRKGIEYFLITWMALVTLWVLWFIGAAATGGVGLVCFPILVLPLILDILIIWDVYKISKGKKPVLPEF